MIALDALTKRFGSLVAVDGITLSVEQGEVLGFLGPNGAGKTTTMRMIAGYLEPSSGTARVSGFDVRTDPIEVKRRLGYLPEGAPLYGEMSCSALLDFVADVRGYRGDEKRQRICSAVETASLAEVMDRPIETLSKGFKRRVGLAQAILHDPEVLILDEPTDGLDPNQKHHVRDLIRRMAENKVIVISTHILEEVEAICTRAVIIAEGRVVADDSADHLLQRLPHHNSVVLTIPATHSAKAVAALQRLTGGREVAVEPAGGNTVNVRVPARSGQSQAAEAGSCLQSAGIAILSMSVERGRLDDVFRQLTTASAAGEEAARV